MLSITFTTLQAWHIILLMSRNLLPIRPRSITLTLLSLFYLGLWNLGRVLVLSQQRDLLAQWTAVISPQWRLLLAAVWGVIFGFLVVLLQGKRPLTRLAIPALLIVYASSEYSLLSFAPFPLTQQSRLCNTIGYTLLIIFTGWALNRPHNPPYFSKGVQEVAK